MTITIAPISKTTLNGYVTVGMIVCGALTQAHGIPLWLSGGAGTDLGVLRIVLGHLQQDAGTTLAVSPTNPIPQQVPSHEVPDSKDEVALADIATFPKN